MVSGDEFLLDCSVEVAAVNTKLSLSDNVLDFGSSATTLSFRIENVGNGGYIDWTISDGGKGWMDIRPKMGRLDEGKSCVVSVTVDRSKMLQSDNGLIVVSGGGESADVMVYASVGKAQDAIMGVRVSMLRFVEGVVELGFRIDNLCPGILSWQMD